MEPLLKGAFPAFEKILGHIRFFYMVDEIWDGKATLAFNAGGDDAAAITLSDGMFHMQTADEEFIIENTYALDGIYAALKQAFPVACRRPYEQLAAHPDKNVFRCGYRCDLCLGSKRQDENNISNADNFIYMNWVCYHNCVPGIEIQRPPADGKGVFHCPGCNLNRNKFCRSFACSNDRGYANCADCGEYHTCDVYKGSHFAGQCNLGITAEEVTKLVIPYCMKERLDLIRSGA